MPWQFHVCKDYISCLNTATWELHVWNVTPFQITAGIFIVNIICDDLTESVRSREQLWETAVKESFNLHNFVTIGLIQVRIWTKCTSPNEHFNETDNGKCHMVVVRLISWDCITLCQYSVRWKLKFCYNLGTLFMSLHVNSSKKVLCHL